MTVRGDLKNEESVEDVTLGSSPGSGCNTSGSVEGSDDGVSGGNSITEWKGCKKRRFLQRYSLGRSVEISARRGRVSHESSSSGSFGGGREVDFEDGETPINLSSEADQNTNVKKERSRSPSNVMDCRDNQLVVGGACSGSLSGHHSLKNGDEMEEEAMNLCKNDNDSHLDAKVEDKKEDGIGGFTSSSDGLFSVGMSAKMRMKMQGVSVKAAMAVSTTTSSSTGVVMAEVPCSGVSMSWQMTCASPSQLCEDEESKNRASAFHKLAEAAERKWEEDIIMRAECSTPCQGTTPTSFLPPAIASSLNPNPSAMSTVPNSYKVRDSRDGIHTTVACPTNFYLPFSNRSSSTSNLIFDGVAPTSNTALHPTYYSSCSSGMRNTTFSSSCSLRSANPAFFQSNKNVGVSQPYSGGSSTASRSQRSVTSGPHRELPAVRFSTSSVTPLPGNFGHSSCFDHRYSSPRFSVNLQRPPPPFFQGCQTGYHPPPASPSLPAPSKHYAVTENEFHGRVFLPPRQYEDLSVNSGMQERMSTVSDVVEEAVLRPQEKVYNDKPSVLVAAQPGISRQQLINSPCPVCGDKITGFHYGIFSCESCKGFFKRTVQNKKNYVCLRGAQCPVSTTTRKKCPACRFDKCLSTGMKLEAIREDRTRGGRSTYQCSYTFPTSVFPHSGSPPSSTKATLLHSSTAYGSGSLHPQDFSLKSVCEAKSCPSTTSVSTLAVRNFQPCSKQISVPVVSLKSPCSLHSCGDKNVPPLIKEIMDVEYLWFSGWPNGHVEEDTRPLHCKSFGAVSPMDDSTTAIFLGKGQLTDSESQMFHTMASMADKRLYKLVKWCKSLPLFSSILVDDQIALLINAWCELLVFSCCYRSLNYPGVIRVSNERYLNLSEARQCGVEKCIEKMLSFKEQLRRLKVDHHEYVSMKVIVLLTSAESSVLKEPENVKNSEEKVVQSLQQYSTCHYPSMPSKFGELLLRIPELHRVCQVGKEMLSLRQSEDDEKPGFNLLMELLRGDP